ncbi:purine nucleosidase [Kaistia soli DSM 19436]|uniref:Purine nucleosidase n=1 Tax=Kaistia soli DSM 19436 TaxID=1122133 RepID=A0A1M4XCV5_9HYPH|nr:nucleoside hydrolase [Kaistia soli]SHE91344.1 purine nucleosidase [Kaistia soli DSM 19436]
MSANPQAAKRHKLILDVDTGTDDAVAIMLAALHPTLELVACTTVNGNRTIEQTTDNTLRVLDHIGRGDIPVHAGLSRPIARLDFPIPRAERDPGVHFVEMPLAPARSRAKATDAVEFLIETYRAATEPITLVPVGPLSNIASALALFPKLVDFVPEVVIMGGGHAVSNVTPSAEFNIWADPEAAALVFAAGFRNLTLVPLDATHKAVISLDQCRVLRESGKPAAIAAATFVEKRIEGYRSYQTLDDQDAAPIHDALCVHHLVERNVIETFDYHVAVETTGALTVGRTVIDTNFRSRQPANAKVAMNADTERFGRFVVDTLTRF